MRIAFAILFMLIVSPAMAASPYWDWQLQGPGHPPAGISWFGLDLDEAKPELVRDLTRDGVATICYVSVGTVENWRSDAAEFPPSLVGKAYDGWQGERFLDIRKREALLPLMRTRFGRCAEMGFSAIEPDNMDVHINDSGFDISPSDVRLYVSALADLAHGMKLKIGQKNAPDLSPDFVNLLDFVITESCFADNWCDEVLAYAKAGKPVLAAEYFDTGVDFAAACAYGRQTGIHFIQKDRDLTTNLTSCD